MATYEGLLNGQKTKITFDCEDHHIKLLRFCEKFKADISTFKLIKHETRKFKK